MGHKMQSVTNFGNYLTLKIHPGKCFLKKITHRLDCDTQLNNNRGLIQLTGQNHLSSRCVPWITTASSQPNTIRRGARPLTREMESQVDQMETQVHTFKNGMDREESNGRAWYHARNLRFLRTGMTRMNPDTWILAPCSNDFTMKSGVVLLSTRICSCQNFTIHKWFIPTTHNS